MQVDPQWHDQVAWQLVINYLSVQGIQWLKMNKWRVTNWISEETPGINKFIAVIISACTAAGINATFQSGTLTVTGLTVLGIATVIRHVVQNYVSIKLMYKVVFPKNGQNNVVTA